MKKLLTLLTILSLAFAAPVFAEEAAPEEGGLTKDVVILFTSDMHCGIEQGFGLVGLETIKETMEADGNYVLLVDDGDAIQGEPIGTMTTGEAITDLMNDIGYDIAIPGNHEFDYGMDRFLELAEKAEFPYISCNLNKEGELVFDPYVIKEFDGVKIAFVGITTPKTLTSSTPKYFQDEEGNYIYSFMQDTTGETLYNAVQNAVDSARAEGAEYVIIMAHCGNEAECRPWTYDDIISHTSGIDVFLDGHSHDTDQVVMKNKDGEDVIRSACGTKLGCVGYVTISAEDGSCSADIFTWNNSIPAPKLLNLSNKMTAEVEEATSELNDKLSEVVAKTAVDLTIYDPEVTDDSGKPIRIIRRAETNLGDLCADAYRDQSGAQIGFVNGGGIRVSIDKGDVTLEEILKVHPFGNLMCVVEVTGQQILDSLEWNSRAVPGESGGFLQVSGLTYEIHTYIESSATEDENGMFTGVDGEYRVKNVLVDGEPLELDKIYTLASHNYMLKDDGDGNTMFRGANILQDEVKLDNQVLIDYITGTLNGVIGEEYAEPYGQGRIIAVEEPPAEEAVEEEAVEEEAVEETAEDEAVVETAEEEPAAE